MGVLVWPVGTVEYAHATAAATVDTSGCPWKHGGRSKSPQTRVMSGVYAHSESAMATGTENKEIRGNVRKYRDKW